MTLTLGDVGVALPVDDGVAPAGLVELGILAEELGYGAVLAGEVRGPDVFALLGALAARTHRVRLGTAVVGLRTRSVPLLAMGFAALDSLAPGRVLAGLGVSSRQIVEGWHAQPYPAPLDQLAETVPRLADLLRGNGVTLANGVDFRLPPAVRGSVPILIGALNPRMRRAAGRIADGVVLAWADPAEITSAVADVRAAAASAGRAPDDVTVAAAVFVHAGEDEDRLPVARADIVERIIRYSLSGGHRERLRRHLPGIDEVARAWAAGERAAARSAVDATAVEAFSVIGPAGSVAERLRALWAAGVDLPLLYPLLAREAGSAAATLIAVARELEAPR